LDQSLEYTPLVPISKVLNPTVASILIVQAPPPPQQDPSFSSIIENPLDYMIEGINKLSL